VPTRTLLVNEIFGPTVQGEGPATGRRCAFVRLAICPLRCRWCDTWYTWAFSPALASHHQKNEVADFASEVHEMAIGDIASQAIFCATGANLVVLSGGEPLGQTPVPLQSPDVKLEGSYEDPLGILVNTLLEAGIETHIETAGVRRPSAFLHDVVGGYVVSPKLASSGNNLAVRRNDNVLRFFADTRKASFKFVITEPHDFSEVSQIASLYKIPPHRIWVMPEGTTHQAIQEKMHFVAERGIRAGYNISSRLHVQIWGDQRGH